MAKSIVHLDKVAGLKITIIEGDGDPHVQKQ